MILNSEKLKNIFITGSLLSFFLLCSINKGSAAESKFNCNIEIGPICKYYRIVPLEYSYKPILEKGLGAELIVRWFLNRRIDLRLQYDYFQFPYFPPNQMLIGGEFYFHRGVKLRVSFFGGFGGFLTSPIYLIGESGVYIRFLVTNSLELTMQMSSFGNSINFLNLTTNSKVSLSGITLGLLFTVI